MPMKWSPATGGWDWAAVLSVRAGVPWPPMCLGWQALASIPLRSASMLWFSDTIDLWAAAPQAVIGERGIRCATIGVGADKLFM